MLNLEEIKARLKHGEYYVPYAPEDITALIAEVETLKSDLHDAKENQCEDFVRMNSEIVTLKKALKLACDDLECGGGCEPAEDAYHAMKDYEHYIQQAQEGQK